MAVNVDLAVNANWSTVLSISEDGGGVIGTGPCRQPISGPKPCATAQCVTLCRQLAKDAVDNLSMKARNILGALLNSISELVLCRGLVCGQER